MRGTVDLRRPTANFNMLHIKAEFSFFFFSFTGGRTYGIPSVRTDLPLPKPRRVSDKTNYGDSSTAFALLHPSVYSLNGVHEEHFKCPRSKAEVRSSRRTHEQDSLGDV